MEPIPLERQITNDKWERAEETLRENPRMFDTLVYEIPGRDVFKLIRWETGFMRLHGTEKCKKCKQVDVRYPNLLNVYKKHGFLCKECMMK